MWRTIYHDRTWFDQGYDVQTLLRRLDQLRDCQDEASLLQRFEVHLALARLDQEPGMARGQEQIEQALAIARGLGDRLREADALNAKATIYLAECFDPSDPEKRPAKEECTTAQRLQ